MKKQAKKKSTKDVPNVPGGDKADAGGQEYGRPEAGWGTAKLKEFGLARLKDAERHEGSALLALARAGEAFAVVRDRLKPRHGWVAWLKKLGVRRQRAWKAIKVHEGASREAAGRGLGVEEVIREKSYTQAMEEWARGEETGEDGGGGPGEKRNTRPGKKTPTAGKKKDEPEGEAAVPAEPNGDIEIAGRTALLHCDLFWQVSSIDKSRPLLVARNWDARTKAALGRQVAVLLVPELDDRRLPAAGEDAA